MELADKLQELGLKALDFAEMTATQLYQFVEKQAPLLLEEWINWNFWTTLIVFILGILILISVIILFWYTMKPDKEKKYNNKWEYWSAYDQDGITPFMFSLIYVILGLISSITFISMNTAWLQILIAPRVWILQNIKDLF